MKIDFAQVKVLITGGTRGIGHALVENFLEAGATVFFTGQNANPKKTVSKANYYSLNFTDDLSIQSFIQDIEKEKIDVLVNNAGINKIDSFGDIALEDFQRIQKVNVEGPFLLCKHLVPAMAERGFGRVVNIASIFSHVSKEKRASYSASKFALVGLSKALALDYAKQNVLVNVVSPGFIDTELTRTILSETQIKELTAQVPMGRLGSPDEIAKAVLFLASKENTFITGQNIIADGGFTCV